MNVSGESEYRLVVGKPEIQKFISQLHDEKWVGHLGFEGNYERARRRFYLPHMKKDIKEYVRACGVCASVKPPQRNIQAEVIPIISNLPFQMITTDILGPLPITKRVNRLVMVVGDHFTKHLDRFALPDQVTKTVAKKLIGFDV